MTPVRRAMLLAAAVVVLAGCMPIPVPGTPRPWSGGLRPEEKIGRSAEKPLRILRADRARVIAVLGPPDEVTLDGRTLTYKYSVVTSRTIWFFPFGVTAVPNDEPRFLRLAFDDRGVLTSFRVYDDWGELANAVGRGGLVSYRSYRRSGAPSGDDLGLPPISAGRENEG